MATARRSGKLYHLFTITGAFLGAPDNPIPGRSEGLMVGVAIAAFVALFGWGATYFGWTDPDGKVQLALAASFILGVFAGYKGRG